LGSNNGFKRNQYQYDSISNLNTKVSQFSRLGSKLLLSFVFEFDFDIDLANQVAVARVMLMKPKMVFLDEATSALDGNNEILVYSILKEVCPTLVSVGHRPALLDLHDMVLWCRDRQSASDLELWDLMTRDEYKQKKRAQGYENVM
jgi:ABC-type transport system involved in Fe-S cluster assembly fused permease/ATPase subunit